MDEPYIVVLKDLDGPCKGIFTFDHYESKEQFDESYKHMSDSYMIVAEGVSEERASEIAIKSDTLDVLLSIAEREAAESPTEEIRQSRLNTRLFEIGILRNISMITVPKYSGERLN